jgi:oligopeptide transport system ATP-binding protein
MSEILFDIRNLKTYFETEAGTVKAVDDVSFQVYRGEVLGIVGESGSGKSVTSLSINRLIPNPPGRIESGEILYHNGGERPVDLLKLSHEEMRAYRGRDIAMVFQEPMTSLNPVFRIGMQVVEAIKYHQEISDEEARRRGIEMLELVGIPAADKRMDDYPHQFSGGMRQRVMIAMALICNPALLIADEPTTALDVTIQAQILQLMLRMKEDRGDASIMLITHDLGVVAETCDRVIVMYGGMIQEVGSVEDIFEHPLHPYTVGLLASLPRPDKEHQKRLSTIRGMVPGMLDMPKGCKFCTRCDKVMPRCETDPPELRQVRPGQWVRCHLFEDQASIPDSRSH